MILTILGQIAKLNSVNIFILLGMHQNFSKFGHNPQLLLNVGDKCEQHTKRKTTPRRILQFEP